MSQLGQFILAFEGLEPAVCWETRIGGKGSRDPELLGVSNNRSTLVNDKAINKVHWSFLVISIFMLIWNDLGCINFFVQMNPERVASFRESEQAVISNRPL